LKAAMLRRRDASPAAAGCQHAGNLPAGWQNGPAGDNEPACNCHSLQRYRDSAFWLADCP
ncbi:MAG: hypothetical protein WB579_17025, partial [Bryobacteraceae bacterium]